MQTRNEKQNQIIITLDRDCSRIDRIDIHPRAFRFTDAIMGLLAKLFKIAPWGAIRHIVYHDGKPVVFDIRGANTGNLERG